MFSANLDSNEIESNSTLQHLNRAFTNDNRILGNWRHLNLEGLNDEESQNLLAKLLDNRASKRAVEKIVSEAQGHPYYLRELARWVSQGEEFSRDTTEADLELRSFLRRRVLELPVFSRELLELISLAAQPVPLSVVFASWY